MLVIERVSFVITINRTLLLSKALFHSRTSDELLRTNLQKENNQILNAFTDITWKIVSKGHFDTTFWSELLFVTIEYYIFY